MVRQRTRRWFRSWLALAFGDRQREFHGALARVDLPVRLIFQERNGVECRGAAALFGDDGAKVFRRPGPWMITVRP